MVDHDYFDILELPLLQGRTFTEQKDPRYNINEIILSESLARELVPDGSAIGKIFKIQPTQPLKVVGRRRQRQQTLFPAAGQCRTSHRQATRAGRWASECAAAGRPELWLRV